MADGGWFFDLPIELRNFVYSQLARKSPMRCGQSYDGGRASMTSYVEPSLLRISKRFKLEYEREIFRKARLTLQLEIGDQTIRLFYPIIQSYAFVNIRNVELTVKMEGWMRTKKALYEKCELLRLCWFPALKKLEIRLEVDLYRLEAWLETVLYDAGVCEIFDHSQAFSDLCAMSFKGAKVESNLYIVTPLVGLSRNINWTILSDADWNDVCWYFLEHEGNRAVFRALPSPSGDGYAYHGMKLELEDCAPMDRDALIEIVEEYVRTEIRI